MQDSENAARAYELLLSRIGKELVGLWDVYVDDTAGSVVYDPISGLGFEAVERRRKELAEDDRFRLVAVAALRSEFLHASPEGRRRVGSFRKTDWYSIAFEQIGEPPAISKAQRHLEKDSDWLAGGPVYTNSSDPV